MLFFGVTNKRGGKEMKRIRVLGLVILMALLSIGGTYLIMEKNYEKETSKNY